jgi:hypothetical protein
MSHDTHRAARAGAANGAATRPRAGRLRLEVVAPSASPEEAAAIVAALERFVRATAPPPGAPADALDPWWRAGIVEAVERETPAALREPWLTG